MAAGGAEEHFAKKLANNEKKIRDRAVNKLRAWIRSRPKDGPGFDEVDLLKIWKGLFYCMWMSDKPLIQEELALNISQLVLSFRNEQSAVLFIKTFFKTIQREWHGIDRLRLDKFYLLIRFFVKETFNFLKKNSWEDRLVTEVQSIFQEEPLNPTSQAVPDGIRLHLVSLYLTELGSVVNDQVNCDTLLQLLDPLLLLVAHSKNKTITNAVEKSLFEHLVHDDIEYSAEIQDSVIAKVDFALVADRLFALASDRNILGRNRNQLYKWVKRLRNHSKGKHEDGCPVQQEEQLNGISECTKNPNSSENKDGSESENESQSSEGKTKRKMRKHPDMNDKQVNSVCGDHESTEELNKRKRKSSKETSDLGSDALCLGKEGTVDELTTEPKKKKKKSKPASDSNDKTPTNKKQASLEHSDDIEESNVVNGHHWSEEETVQQTNKSQRNASRTKDAKGVDGNTPGSTDKASFVLSNTEEKKVLQKAASGISEPFAQFKKSSTPPAFVRKCLPKTPRSEPQRRKANEVQNRTPGSVQGRGASKRVRIEVSKNTAHTTQDYQRSLKESPKIPFDANKTPIQGLLKSIPSQAVLKSPPKPRRTPLPLNKSASSSKSEQRPPKPSKSNKRPRAVDFF